MAPPNDPENSADLQPTQSVESERQSEKFAATRDQLLAQVLSETLHQRREDSDGMLLALRQWRATLGDTAFDSDLVQQLIPEVLRYRMGNYSSEILDPLCLDIAAVLWNDPVSRNRIERLWQSLETNP